MTVVEVLEAVAAATAAVVAVGGTVTGGLWWLFGPRVRTWVQEQSAAARQLQPNSGSSVADKVTRTDRVTVDLNSRLDALEDATGHLVQRADANAAGITWAGRTLDQVANELQSVQHRLDRGQDRLDTLTEGMTETAGQLHTHVVEARELLGALRPMLPADAAQHLPELRDPHSRTRREDPR